MYYVGLRKQIMTSESWHIGSFKGGGREKFVSDDSNNIRTSEGDRVVNIQFSPWERYMDIFCIWIFFIMCLFPAFVYICLCIIRQTNCSLPKLLQNITLWIINIFNNWQTWSIEQQCAMMLPCHLSDTRLFFLSTVAELLFCKIHVLFTSRVNVRMNCPH
jgi:hypothetical protein